MDSAVRDILLGIANISLKSMNHPLQVKRLYFTVNNHNEILFILPYINPKPLELILISEPSGRDNIVLNLDEIGQLDQWKHAKELSIYGFQITNLSQNIRHFSSIFIQLREVPTEQIIFLKEIFLISSTLTTMDIHFDYHRIDIAGLRLIESFGEPLVDNNQNRIWFIRIPDTIQFLRITLEFSGINYHRIEQSDLPRYAIISNRIKVFGIIFWCIMFCGFLKRVLLSIVFLAKK